MTTPAWNPVFAGDRAPAETTFNDPPPPRRLLARLDPRAQVLCCLTILATVVTTPAHQLSAFLGYTVLLIGLFALAGAAPTPILRRIGRFLPLLLLLVLPVLLAPLLAPSITPPPVAPPLPVESTPIDRLAGWLALPPTTLWLAWNMTIKALLGFSTILLLQTLLPFERLLSALNRLHAPRILTTLLQLTHRYSGVLGEEAARMNRARTARGGLGSRARWIWQALPAGHLIGSLFVRSLDRGERVHQAMLARGFDGVALTGHRADLAAAAWRAADTAALLALAGVLIALRASTL